MHPSSISFGVPTCILLSSLLFQLCSTQSLDPLENNNHGTPSSTSSSSLVSTAIRSDLHHDEIRDSERNSFGSGEGSTSNDRGYTVYMDGTKKCFDGNENEEPLACWLRSLEVSIPDASFNKGFLSLVSGDLVSGDACSLYRVSNVK